MPLCRRADNLAQASASFDLIYGIRYFHKTGIDGSASYARTHNNTYKKSKSDQRSSRPPDDDENVGGQSISKPVIEASISLSCTQLSFHLMAGITVVKAISKD